MRLRFRTLLVGVMTGFVLATAVAISVPAYVTARQGAEDLAGQVIEQASQRAESEIQSLLGEAAVQGELTARLFRTGQLSPDDCARTTEYFLQGMRVLPRLSYLSYTRERDGLHCEAMRQRDGGDGKLFVRWLVREPDGRLSLTDYDTVGQALVPTFRDEDRPENDARERPWYKLAAAAKQSTWTETYVFIGEAGSLDVPGVTYATPLYGELDELVGELTADFDLLSLSRFLADERVLDHGASFVLEYRADGTRRVVAHPSPEILMTVTADGGHEALPAEQLSDPRVTRFVEALPARWDDLPPAAVARYGADGEPFLGSWRKVEDRPGLRWLVCTVVPESDVLSRVRFGVRVTGLLGLAAVLAAIALATWVSGLIASPLGALVNETREIGRFKLDARPRKAGMVDEVAHLEGALEHMKSSLRSFRKFVPDDIVRNLLASGQEARLGGRRQIVTVYFTDIEGFTSLAETMPPEQLVALLSEYLDAMTDEIHQGGGTVDKYIGDAVMALWGAPSERPDHALAACRTALASQRRLARLGASWKARGLPALVARIGVNTGDAIVGNLGSESRLDYTAIGDSVNLASRLEALNKEYDTTVLLGENTYDLVAEAVIARPIDRVAVKGRSGGLLVYELLGLIELLDESAMARATSHTDAFTCYAGRQFADAVAILRTHLARWPDDTPAKHLLGRCEAYVHSPPPDDWDGVFRMTRKK